MNGKFIDRNDNLRKNNMGGTEETSRGPIGNFGAGNLLLVDNMVRQQQQQQQSGATIVSKVSAVIDAQPRRRSHPHVCLCGTLHLVNGMWLLIGIGIFMFAALCVAEVLYFRRALFVMAIPGVVLILSTVAVGKREPRFLWPIIGISFFHLFLDAYLTLIFLFFFLFKPLYIIMVLNWAFDTLHTSKTPSYYAHCAVIFTILIVFFLSNLWQLHISLRFQTYLEELLGSGSSATASTGGSGESSSSASNDGSVMKCGGKMGINGQNHHAHQHQFRVLNEPPILLFGDGITASSGNQQRMLLCPSPASQRAGGPHNLRSSGMGPRRPSLSEIRQFSTR